MIAKLKFLIKLLLLGLAILMPLSATIELMMAQKWNSSRPVEIYLLNAAPADAQLASYLEQITQATFQPLERFFTTQAARIGLVLDPTIRINVTALKSNSAPPLLEGTTLTNRFMYSMKFRLWALKNLPWVKLGTVQIVARYVDERLSWPEAAQAYGFIMGTRHLINLNGSNETNDFNLVKLARAYLMTLGVSPKVNDSGQPLYPEGFANPSLRGLYPQNQAELASGLVPISQSHSAVPMTLDNCMIGDPTAKELGWTIF